MKKLAEKVHWDTLTHFIAVPDKELHPEFFDHWKSSADEVEAGKTFKDDCDGFCLTSAELLVRQGADPETVRIVQCHTGIDGHLVTAYGPWILDNLQRRPIYWKDLNYTWLSQMKMSEKGIWRNMG